MPEHMLSFIMITHIKVIKNVSMAVLFVIDKNIIRSFFFSFNRRTQKVVWRREDRDEKIEDRRAKILEAKTHLEEVRKSKDNMANAQQPKARFWSRAWANIKKRATPSCMRTDNTM